MASANGSALPGPPWKWELDPQGRPRWILAAAQARWARVFEWDLAFGAVLRFAMPALESDAQVRRNGHERSDRNEAVRRAAGLRDAFRCDYDYIARQVRMIGDARMGSDRKSAKRRVREGRIVLSREGVLPWAAYGSEGALPKRWWKDEPFLEALDEWCVGPVEELDPGLVFRAARQAISAASLVQSQLRGTETLLRRLVAGR
jgi:hypothetical protein